MKIRYPVIGIIIILILTNCLPIAPNILGILLFVCLGLIVYLIIRNIFRAVKGAVTGIPQGGNYRDEARRACEKVTPKKNKDVTPPWEG